MKPKSIQQIIDGQERRRPLEKGFGAAIAESKRSRGICLVAYAA